VPEPRAAPESAIPFDPVDRARWDEAVRAILSREAAGEVQKAVLARTLEVAFPEAPDPLRVLRFLRAENPRAHVFLIEVGPGRVFLGAAPEILAELRGGVFQATAVAGSAPRGGTADEDAQRAAALLASAKDLAEHAFTSDEMREVLADRLDGMEVELEPRILRLARIQHLETRIRGRARAGEDALSLVEALHPTPAVCGRPRARALELIREREPFERGWYAGPVGWFDPAGDGDFVPALRSAVGGGRRWRLYAGAGIVPGSDPALEWEETALKFEPALRALRAGVR
jgi:isochorismate synthase